MGRVRFGGRLTRRVASVVVALSALAAPAMGFPYIRQAFFNAYPKAVGTRLDRRADNTQHCGVCHFDFNGGGPRNPYGQLVEAALPNFPDTPQGRIDAILSIENEDPEPDGFSAVVEITDGSYANTPTFPGLYAANVGQTSNIDIAEIIDYLTPADPNDTTPPAVSVISPPAGAQIGSSSAVSIQWTATDDSGSVVSVSIFVSFDGGASFSPIVLSIPNSGSYTWFAQNRPTTQAQILVEATDPSNNVGGGLSGTFEIYSSALGRVPTTLRDFDMPGTQPLFVSEINDSQVCGGCHGYYDQAVEPYFTALGSMMSHASNDPVFRAALDIANADAPESGDLCLRCHAPKGWLEGRSTPTDGSQLTFMDTVGVNCDVCHRMVDPVYQAGISPIEDASILAELDEIPQVFSSAQYVIDPDNTRRRGPFADHVAPHGVIVSPFHQESAFCGTCHDVSNPVFVRNPDGTYSPNGFDEPAASFGAHQIGAVERTYSEWFYSAYNTPKGVYAPDLGGNKEYVRTCQDCHMRDVTGAGCFYPDAPIRDDLPLHDLTGGSTWLPPILEWVDAKVNTEALIAGAERARRMLQLAAELDATQAAGRLVVTVTNRTGHKLPTGYPEGRRMWLNVRFYDRHGQLVGESGAYDYYQAVLLEDPELKVYEAKPVIGENIADIVGLPANTEFHFVLNNKWLKDNRIPPLGFTNADYEAFGGAPVGATYADGQNYDITYYQIPPRAARAEVTLYYQSLTREYVEFLRDEGQPGGAGDTLYWLWSTFGKCPPEPMATVSRPLYGYIRPSSASAGNGGNPIAKQ